MRKTCGGWGEEPQSSVQTTAVKRLNRYFCFLLLGFPYQLEKNGQRCINQLVNITIFPFFSKFELFSLKTLRAKRESCLKMAPIITSASVFNHLELF